MQPCICRAEPREVLPGRPNSGGGISRSRSRVEEGEARQKGRRRDMHGGRWGSSPRTERRRWWRGVAHHPGSSCATTRQWRHRDPTGDRRDAAWQVAVTMGTTTSSSDDDNQVGGDEKEQPCTDNILTHQRP
jgi:hypothetical protein